jgi:ABC-2 type transport system ATP-binding protein
MLRRIKTERNLTIVMTTHYMDEADKLCDRIAIVDHGRLIALDSPLTLKAAVAAASTLEVSFSTMPTGWEERLARLPGVDRVHREGSVARLTSHEGPVTTMAVLTAAAEAGIEVESIAVASTTMDDVFLHYTGHDLRDALQGPSAADSPFMLRR